MTRRALLVVVALAAVSAAAALVWLTPAGHTLRSAWAAQQAPEIAHSPSQHPLPPDRHHLREDQTGSRLPTLVPAAERVEQSKHAVGGDAKDRADTVGSARFGCPIKIAVAR